MVGLLRRNFHSWKKWVSKFWQILNCRQWSKISAHNATLNGTWLFSGFRSIIFVPSPGIFYDTLVRMSGALLMFTNSWLYYTTHNTILPMAKQLLHWPNVMHKCYKAHLDYSIANSTSRAASAWAVSWQLPMEILSGYRGEMKGRKNG